ncbi:MAG: PD-(D/E)XK nuclease family protein [Clostridia bacterium]|nr:PD-(D/E)XK nuclease family protein [Clostridia bacterium]
MGNKDNSTTNQQKESEQFDYLIQKLNELDESLTKIELSRSDEINVFYATGMTTQEIKHSAFLSWLLNPNLSHKKGNAFLGGFLKLLYEYSGNADEDIKSNKDILANGGITSFNDFAEFLDADDIVVETEKVITNPESRIDIFIQSKKAETTIVIENKVFTGTHDEQLKRYEEETAVFTGRKIYVYLTPNGDMPTNTAGEYQQNWTIISYGSIIDFLGQKLKEIPKTKQFEKLIFLLKDYIEMVDTNILRNNVKIRALCKEILKKHADAIELLNHYTDNVDEVYEFIYEWVKENISDIHYIYFKGRQLSFYTNKIFDFFAKFGRQVEITKSWFAFQVGVNSKDGPIKLGIGLGKQTEEWGEPETIIKEKVLPDKLFGNKYCTLFQIELLSDSDRQLSIEEIKPQLEERLQIAKNKLEGIENLL